MANVDVTCPPTHGRVEALGAPARLPRKKRRLHCRLTTSIPDPAGCTNHPKIVWQSFGFMQYEPIRGAA